MNNYSIFKTSNKKLNLMTNNKNLEIIIQQDELLQISIDWVGKPFFLINLGSRLVGIYPPAVWIHQSLP